MKWRFSIYRAGIISASGKGGWCAMLQRRRANGAIDIIAVVGNSFIDVAYKFARALTRDRKEIQR